MADIRINSLSTTASSSASDDFIAVDGTTNGTRKLNAYSPSFGGDLEVLGAEFEMSGNGAHVQLVGTGTAQKFFRSQNTGGDLYTGVESSVAGAFFTGSAAYDSVWYSPTNDSYFKTPLAKFSGNLTVSATTASTSTSTGALVVSGGVGVAKDLYVGGTVITLQPGSGTTAPQQKIVGPSGASYGPSLFLDASATTSGKVYIVGSGLSGDNGGLGSFYVYDVSAANSVLKIVNSNTTLAGNLTVSGTGTSSFGGPLSINQTLTGVGGTFTYSGLTIPHYGLSWQDLSGGVVGPTAFLSGYGGIRFFTAGTFAGMFAHPTGNLLIGGTTDISGTGGLKVFGTTASTSTSTGALVVSGGVGVGGNINVSGYGAFGTGQFIAATAPTTGVGVEVSYNGGTGFVFGYNRGTSSPIPLALQHAGGNLLLGTTTDGGQKLQVSGTAAITGAISIGNTVNTVSPTSPNRTITMVIGGTTYYIHAKTTND